MDEIHLSEDEVLALALGDLRPDQSSVLRHLNNCPLCRTAYDELSRAVDEILPAAPTVAPPAGFDVRVLDRLGLRSPQRSRSYRIPVLIAAAAIVGLVLGAFGAGSLMDRSTTTTIAGGASLVTNAGSAIGSVEPSQADGQEVIVLQITKGIPGIHYTCRMRLADGTVRDAGNWLMPDSGRATWIAYGSTDNIDRVELVTDDGKVWATAELS